MVRSKTRLTGALALVGISALALAACTSDTGSDGGDASGENGDTVTYDCADGATSADTLKIGTILPVTGTLAALGPPEIAGVGYAVQEINEAGTEACTFWTDSGDGNDMTVSTASAASLIDEQVSVAIGAASSSVSLNFVDQLTSTPIVQISPANTAADLSGISPYFFRTAPEDSVQGSVLGNLIAADGNTNVAFLVFNDAYGTGLRNFTQSALEDAGATITYGGEGQGQEFPPQQTTFSAEVSAALASDPDAIVIIAFEETISVIPELVAQGWDMSKTYYTDGNLQDYSEDFEPGTLEGAQGTYPGANPPDEFRTLINGWYEAAEGESLRDYTYGAESYDAVILAALAAAKGGATDPETIQQNLHAVSGSTDGTVCATYAECLELIEAGEEISFDTVSGAGTFNDNNDPSSAFIGIYEFDENNVNIWQSAQERAAAE